MSIQVVTKLSGREKIKKTEEAKKWLQEQGELPDLQLLRQTLLEAHSLTQSLMHDLHQQEEKNLAASKLAGHIEALIQTIKP